ncbi:hypothetical protein EDB19DRAFT_1826906 [Suillus lakei]|nr:hypothetical protein EDB19DRAFT_1826906 [Suillus lakei]
MLRQTAAATTAVMLPNNVYQPLYTCLLLATWTSQFFQTSQMVPHGILFAVAFEVMDLHYDPRSSSGMNVQHMGPNHLDGSKHPGPTSDGWVQFGPVRFSRKLKRRQPDVKISTTEVLERVVFERIFRALTTYWFEPVQNLFSDSATPRTANWTSSSVPLIARTLNRTSVKFETVQVQTMVQDWTWPPLGPTESFLQSPTKLTS